MKATENLALIMAVLLCLAVFPSSSSAATNPLNNPRGLAVAANGDLYVANQNDNNIVVFGPGYAQLTKMTITQNVSMPATVAFDALGNLWVANDGPSNGLPTSIAQYFSSGGQTGRILNSNDTPTGLAIDGDDNMFVGGTTANFSELQLFAATQPYGPITQISYNTQLPVSSGNVSVAVSGGILAVGFSSPTFGTFSENSVFFALTSHNLNAGGGGAFPTVAITPAANGVFYFADASGNIYYVFFNGAIVQLANVGFVPTGIAVDNVRGRIYVANGAGNSIAVYNTLGTLIHTIL